MTFNVLPTPEVKPFRGHGHRGIIRWLVGFYKTNIGGPMTITVHLREWQWWKAKQKIML